ncbi:Gfo/Idh/MocA family oxidoreductase [Gracilibacillus oryzae]|uniref:Gfo/Idh/MocA family oxidoreductase n=1 Tax=Gracilibacillus oryzae TaxID=1672701 RepID=A0A7C8GR37_9BACI|nr:Gfo/Idh/MocA family oxidoreductase [Gracilibacillus oryzae]KAB8127494.1 Gfo/Idh/MocA family oxidoreductase [Gracilibacillus oryzae]
MKIGVISFAHMHAYSYAKAFSQLDDVEITAVTDEDETRGKQAAENLHATFYSSYEELLKQDIDAVIITSENIHHCKHTVAAAKAKKHVLVEKPMATTIEDAEKMIQACKDNGVLLQVAYPVRFNTTIMQAKAEIDNGTIGEVLAINATNRGKNPGGWFVDKEKSGGGAVMDHTVHVVDVIRSLINSEVKEVYAEVDQLFHDKPIDDAGVLTMSFTNGVFATLDCSWSKNRNYPSGADVTLEIIGTEGILSVDAFKQYVQVSTVHYSEQNLGWGDSMNESLIRDFIQNISEGKDPATSGYDGLKAVEVILAAYESAEKVKTISIG